MMKVIVVFYAFISKWETPTWPPSIQMGETAGIFLASILLTKRDALSSLYEISMVFTCRNVPNMHEVITGYRKVKNSYPRFQNLRQLAQLYLIFW